MSVSERILIGMIAFCLALISPSIFATFGGAEMTPAWRLVGVGVENPIQFVSLTIITIVTYFNIRILLWMSMFATKSKYGTIVWSAFSNVIAFVLAFMIHSGIRSTTTWVEFWSIGKDPTALPALSNFPAFVWECAVVAVLLVLAVRSVPSIGVWLKRDTPLPAPKETSRTREPVKSF